MILFNTHARTGSYLAYQLVFRNLVSSKIIPKHDQENIINAIYLNGFYLILSISVFYYSFDKARDKGTLINIGE